MLGLRPSLLALVLVLSACGSAPRPEPAVASTATPVAAPAVSAQPASAQAAPVVEQSEQEGVALLCNAPTTCPECLRAGDRHKTVFAVEAKYGPSITNPDARVMWDAVKNVDAQSIVTVLRHGAAPCPLADWIEQQPLTEGPTFIVRGKLSHDDVLSVVRPHLTEVNACYHQLLPTPPRPEAEVTIKLVVAPEGTVQLAAVLDSTLDDSKVMQCIVNLVKTWTFPKPAENIAVVTYPFRVR